MNCTFRFYCDTLYFCSCCLYISKNTSLQAWGAGRVAVNTCGFQGSINNASHVDGGNREREKDGQDIRIVRNCFP